VLSSETSGYTFVCEFECKLTNIASLYCLFYADDSMCIRIEGIDGIFLMMCGEVYVVHRYLEWDCC